MIYNPSFNSWKLVTVQIYQLWMQTLSTDERAESLREEEDEGEEEGGKEEEEEGEEEGGKEEVDEEEDEEEEEEDLTNTSRKSWANQSDSLITKTRSVCVRVCVCVSVGGSSCRYFLCVPTDRILVRAIQSKAVITERLCWSLPAQRVDSAPRFGINRWSVILIDKLQQGSGAIYGSSGDGIWLPDNFELRKQKSPPATLSFSLSRQITAEVIYGPFF